MSRLDPFHDDLMRWRGEGKSLRDMEVLLMEYGVDVTFQSIRYQLNKWGAPDSTNKGRPIDPGIVARNKKIYALRKQGLSFAVLAERFGLKKQHLHVIVSQVKARA